MYTSDDAEVSAAVKALAEGLLVAFPTETVYGLGADATSPEAVARIFAAKSRPTDHPLIVHVGRHKDLHRFGRNVDVKAERLVAAFWPGPLTIIVERADEIVFETTGGRETVGLRMPDHPLALALLNGFADIGSGAVAAPSANRFGGVSPTTAQHVRHDLGDKVAVILDGGPCRVGVESTIVDLSGERPQLLRPGGISSVEIEAVLGHTLDDGRSAPSRAPGMLESHYAPAAQIVLVDPTDLAGIDFRNDEGLLAVRDDRTPTTWQLSSRPPSAELMWMLPADAGAYATELYATLRDADRRGVRRLLVMPPTSGELMDAVLDRLAKAAAPR